MDEVASNSKMNLAETGAFDFPSCQNSLKNMKNLASFIVTLIVKAGIASGRKNYMMMKMLPTTLENGLTLRTPPFPQSMFSFS